MGKFIQVAVGIVQVNKSFVEYNRIGDIDTVFKCRLDYPEMLYIGNLSFI